MPKVLSFGVKFPIHPMEHQLGLIIYFEENSIADTVIINSYQFYWLIKKTTFANN